ncbi:heparinase II/III family protein [Marinobacter sp. F4218]|uniref:heparinase II/III family protein n=1 Tax=Marinobacter sp. F4218 TaxID=2862868 RepID=UPI001C62DD79|nr:alginate lyase family protein [Marinobacter sp. F4218]MBW7470441.1 heparinase II/III family protein [Marinobacter sp. F4218]
MGPDRFLFLNEEGALASLGWDCEQRSKLWRYNQHYFDDLNAEQADSRVDWHRSLMQRWVAENPPGQGSGWEPYPTSLRIVNWVKWAMAGRTLPEDCLESLAVQARWLARRLEIHLLGNHLFANAKALVFAGSYFSGPEAEKWLKTGFGILEREVPEQILPDGGHFERSTMYHALALEDMLDLLNILRCLERADRPTVFCERRLASQFLAAWPELINKMVGWLNAMRHPDGELSFFNDAALGIAPPCESLLAYARRLNIEISQAGLNSLHLAESGYVRLAKPEACLVFDAAPVGPDYLPGHAHADTLSLELSLFGQRVFVNSGTSEYGVGTERLRQRGTAAHNTVEVNGTNSSEVWSGFRVARRAYPGKVKVYGSGGSLKSEACHDGYQRLATPVSVCRTIELNENRLEIEDAVEGQFETSVGRFYSHPSVQIEKVDQSQLVLKLPGHQRVRVHFEGAAKIEVNNSTWHPRFGVAEPNQCIAVSFMGSRVLTTLEWSQR